MGKIKLLSKYAGLGTLGYFVPRFLSALGVPFDEWANKLSTLVKGAPTMFDQDIVVALLGIIFAVGLMSVGLWTGQLNKLFGWSGRHFSLPFFRDHITERQYYDELVKRDEFDEKIEEIRCDPLLSVLDKDDAIKKIQKKSENLDRRIRRYVVIKNELAKESKTTRIPLSEAAVRVYEVTKDKFTATIAESDGRIECAYAHAFFRTSDVPIYGRAPTSQVAVEIPRHYLLDLNLSDDASDLRDSNPNGRHFTDLEINESDVEKLIEVIRGAPV